MKTNPVKSRFAVPAAIALAGHAFLFFGFRSPQVPPPIDAKGEQPEPARKWPEFVRVEPIAPPDVASTSAEPWSLPATPTPASLPDLATDVIPIAAITVPVQVTQPDSMRNTHLIPEGIPGPEITGVPGGQHGPFHSIDLDNAPRPKFQARPMYPSGMRQMGTAGEVLVDFLVDEQGNVSDVRVLRSTHRDFEDPTVRAVSKWKFEPGKRNGRTVQFRMAQPIGFTIGE